MQIVVKLICVPKKKLAPPSRKDQGGRNPTRPKPEEQEDMPHHYPPAKHRENRNPRYHEEHQKDVA
jgi:hypothetical protein